MSARRILLADDEEMVRLSLRDMLELAGCDVVGEAADGEDAVRQAKALRPDAVLMDINMPRMDGVQAAQEIMASAPSPIVFLTAYADAQNVSRANEAGGYAYLVKPCRHADLGPAIEMAIARFQDSQRQQQEAENVRWALDTVRRLSREIITNADIASVVDLALRCVTSAMKVPAAAVMLVQKDHLHIRAQLGLDPGCAGAFRVPLGDTIYGEATLSCEPASFSGSDPESLRGPLSSSMQPFGLVGSSLTVPLQEEEDGRRGEVMGCLAVFRAEPAPFAPADLSVLSALAGELIIAFEVAHARQALAWRAWRNAAGQ